MQYGNADNFIEPFVHLSREKDENLILGSQLAWNSDGKIRHKIKLIAASNENFCFWTTIKKFMLSA